QMSPKLRFSYKYSGERQRSLVQPGNLAGFSDAYVPYPFIGHHGAAVNWVLSAPTFVEATYARIQNELAGGNEGGLLVNDTANRLNGLAAFKLLYKDAGKISTDSYAYSVMQ